MLQVGQMIVSEEILAKEFVCDLKSCKGACCVQGEAGAPLEEQEAKILEEIYPKIQGFLNQEGSQAIEEQGVFVKNNDKDLETPLVQGKHCAYTVFDKHGNASCGIEKVYSKGEISFRKPMSCYLYPIRVKSFSVFKALNYEHWDICNSACELGSNLKIPLYKFLKQPLIDYFGESWYQELESQASAS